MLQAGDSKDAHASVLYGQQKTVRIHANLIYIASYQDIECCVCHSNSRKTRSLGFAVYCHDGSVSVTAGGQCAAAV